MWCSEPDIDSVKVTAVGADPHVKWVSFEGGVNSLSTHAEWSSLWSGPILEMQRLAIGLVVSEILQAEQLPYYCFLADGGNVLNISHAVDPGMCRCP